MRNVDVRNRLSIYNPRRCSGDPSQNGEGRQAGHLLPQGRSGGCSGRALPPRVPDVLAYVPEFDPRPGKRVSRDRARLPRSRPERHSGSGDLRPLRVLASEHGGPRARRLSRRGSDADPEVVGAPDQPRRRVDLRRRPRPTGVKRARLRNQIRDDQAKEPRR